MGVYLTPGADILYNIVTFKLKPIFMDNSRLDEIFEVVTFIKDNAVTKQEFDGLGQEVGGLRQEFGGLRQKFDELKREVMKIEATMVTKDYLDEKLSVAAIT